MVSEPMLSFRQEKIWGMEISLGQNELPIKSVQNPLFLRYADTNIFWLFFFSKKKRMDVNTKE